MAVACAACVAPGCRRSEAVGAAGGAGPTTGRVGPLGALPQASAPTTAEADALDLDSARAALVRLVEARDDYGLGLTLDDLRGGPAKKLDDGCYEVGRWNICPGEKRFLISIFATEFFEEYGGRFERESSGLWRAEIDHELHGVLAPPP